MKKLIDQRGKLFGVISVIDAAVLCVVVLLAAGVYLRFFVLENTAAPAAGTTTVTYTLRVENVREYALNSLREGDRLYAKEDGAFIGTVTGIESAPGKMVTTLADGSYAEVNAEGRLDLQLTISAEGRVTDGRVYVNKTREINTSIKIDVYTKYVGFATTVTGIA
jgi:hypothetical protein